MYSSILLLFFIPHLFSGRAEKKNRSILYLAFNIKKMTNMQRIGTNPATRVKY